MEVNGRISKTDWSQYAYEAKAYKTTKSIWFLINIMCYQETGPIVMYGQINRYKLTVSIELGTSAIIG